MKKNYLINKYIFRFSLTVILISIFTLTIGQKIPIEFKNNSTQSDFYSFIYFGFPISIILTLFGTIKNQNTKLKNWIIGLSTILISTITFYVLVTFLFSIAFYAWTNAMILYRNKKDKNVTITEQIYDMGAFGYGKRRVTELKPFLKYFEIVKIIDTTKIDKKDWIKTNEEGNIHFP